MSGGIRKEDIEDLDVVDAVELASDGTVQIFASVSVVSTTASSKQVALSGVDLFRDPELLEYGDIVILSGTTGGADGTYHVDQRVDATTFTVQEAIVDSTGGSCEARHPSGASRVGLDPSNIAGVSATNVQEALEQLALGASGLPTKSGRVLAASFLGTPKKATVTFSTAFASAGYSVTLDVVVSGSKGYDPYTESKAAGSFVINLGSNKTAGLVEVGWQAVLDGET